VQRFQAILLAAGLIAAVALIGASGFADVTAALATAGWGILWVILFHALPLAADMLGWARLFDDRERPPAGSLYLVRWVSESVNNLLPVAQVGGEVVRTRLVQRRGCPGDHVGATVVIDLTMGMFTQIIFAAAGLALLVALTGFNERVGAIMTGITVLSVLVVAFFFAQRAGLIGRAGNVAAWVGRMIKTDGLFAIVGNARRLDTALHAIYRRRGRLVRCAGLRMVSWFLGAFEVWLGMYVLGHPVGAAEAIVIQSLAMAIRSAAFVIPAGLGVQEGGFLVVGTLLGLPPEAALAMALLRRVREILFGLPGLGIWWLMERRPAS
jgi:putative membrane protein